MKKVKNERPTWALFRHVPNNVKGRKFLELFKKYKNENATYYLKGRVPVNNGSYDMGGNCPMLRASEFSIYVKTPPHIKYNDLYWKLTWKYHDAQNEIEELTKARLDWRNDYYELHQMNIFQFAWYKFQCYKFKIS